MVVAEFGHDGGECTAIRHEILRGSVNVDDGMIGVVSVHGRVKPQLLVGAPHADGAEG